MSNKKGYVVGGLGALAVAGSLGLGGYTLYKNMEAHDKLGAQNSAQIAQNSGDIEENRNLIGRNTGRIGDLEDRANTLTISVDSDIANCELPQGNNGDYITQVDIRGNPSEDHSENMRYCDFEDVAKLQAEFENGSPVPINSPYQLPLGDRNLGDYETVFITSRNDVPEEPIQGNSRTPRTQINLENRVAPPAEGECTLAQLRNITDSLSVADEHGNHLGDVSRVGYLDGTPESFGEYVTEEILDNFLDANYNTTDISMINSEGREVTYTIGDSRSNSEFIDFVNTQIRDNCVNDVGLEAILDNESHISSQRVAPTHSHTPRTQTTSYTPTITQPLTQEVGSDRIEIPGTTWTINDDTAVPTPYDQFAQNANSLNCGNRGHTINGHDIEGLPSRYIIRANNGGENQTFVVGCQQQPTVHSGGQGNAPATPDPESNGRGVGNASANANDGIGG